MARYTRVDFVERRVPGRKVLDKLVLRSDENVFNDAGTPVHWIREIPVQAVADRGELFGFDVPEQSLEFLGRATQDLEAGDVAVQTVYPAYAEFVQAECRAVMAGMTVPELVPQARTFMAADFVVPDPKMEALDAARAFACERVRMQSLNRGSLRLMSLSEPADRPAANALSCTDEVLQDILLALDKSADVLATYRLETVFNAAPFFKEALMNGSTSS